MQSNWESQFKHRLGRFGYPIHLVLALIACAGIAGPTVMVELGVLPLLVCWLLRLPFVWRMTGDVLRQPGAFVLLGWCGWTMLSLSWSESRGEGWLELSYTRWLWLGLALWPVMDRRKWLIGALCVGFAVAHVVQAVEFVAMQRGVELLRHPEGPDRSARLSGWWYHPVVGGAMCAASMGLHLGPALFGTGWRRKVGWCGVVIAILGLIATGSRGPWIGGACTLAFALLVLLARSSMRERVRVLLVALTFCALLAGVVLLTPLGEGVRGRVQTARVEASRVLDLNDVNTDIGGRVLAAHTAWDALATHPLHGVGAGSFRLYLASFIAERGIRFDGWRAEKLKNAHNLVLHIGATTGIIGLAWFALLGACMLWSQAREAGLRGLGTYSASPLLATIALVFCGAFDVIHLNHYSAALLSLLLALSAPVRPIER